MKTGTTPNVAGAALLGAAQDALSRRVLHVPLFIVAVVVVVPAHQMVKSIIVQAGGSAACSRCRARGDIAPAIVAGGVGLGLAAGGRARRPRWIEADQLMGLTRVAVEVLVGTTTIVGALPELAQVGVDVLVAVGGSTNVLEGVPEPQVPLPAAAVAQTKRFFRRKPLFSAFWPTQRLCQKQLLSENTARITSFSCCLGENGEKIS